LNELICSAWRRFAREMSPYARTFAVFRHAATPFYVCALMPQRRASPIIIFTRLICRQATAPMRYFDAYARAIKSAADTRAHADERAARR